MGGWLAALAAVLVPPACALAAGAMEAAGPAPVAGPDARAAHFGWAMLLAATSGAVLGGAGLLSGCVGLRATRDGARRGRRLAGLAIACALGGVGWTVASAGTWVVLAPRLRADLQHHPDADVIAALADPEPTVRRAAVAQVRVRRLAAACDALAAALGNERDPKTLQAMFAAGAELGRGNEALRAAFVRRMASAEHAAAAKAALKQILVPAFIPLLVADQARGAVAGAALEDLAVGLAMDPGDRSAEVAALAALLGAADGGPKVTALRVLGALADRARPARAAIESLLADPEPELAWHAAWALVRLHGRAPAGGRLTPNRDELPPRSHTALQGAAFRDVLVRHVAVVEAALQSRDLFTRMRAAELLGYAPRNPATLDALQQLVGGAHGRGPDTVAAGLALQRLRTGPRR